MSIDTLKAAPNTRRLSQIGLAGLSVAIAVWLGYAAGRGQSLAEVARLYRDENVMQYTLDSGQLVAVFSRTGGDLKPLLRTPDGTSLMDFSDWDYTASVVADGQRFEFVRLIPTASVDYARNRIVAGMNSGDWVLTREITLDGGAAEVRFSLLANRVLSDIRVTVAHANWYFLNVTLIPDGFRATVARASRSEIETGTIRSPSYELTLNSTPLDNLVTPGGAEVATTTNFGVQAVTTTYAVRNPPIGRLTPIATERITARTL